MNVEQFFHTNICLEDLIYYNLEQIALKGKQNIVSYLKRTNYLRQFLKNRLSFHFRKFECFKILLFLL